MRDEEYTTLVDWSHKALGYVYKNDDGTFEISGGDFRYIVDVNKAAIIMVCQLSGAGRFGKCKVIPVEHGWRAKDYIDVLRDITSNDTLKRSIFKEKSNMKDMSLLEAKKLMRRNGYVLETFADDAAEYRKVRAKRNRFWDMETKYGKQSGYSIALNDFLTLKINRDSVSLEKKYDNPSVWGPKHLNSTLFEMEFEKPEELLELFPTVQKRAIKACMQYIDVNDDDVDVDEAIADIKENIAKCEEHFKDSVKARKRSARLDAIEDKIYAAHDAAEEKAWQSWQKENKIKVGSNCTYIMKSGKEVPCKVTGEKTDKKTGEKYWILTKTSDGKNITVNKDKSKRDTAISLDVSSYHSTMYKEAYDAVKG